MVLVNIPSEYGYVVLVGAASQFVIAWMGIKVGQARKAYNVEYPQMYAEQSEIAKNPKKKTFNCIQRAHQNTLENYPQFLFSLLVGGIRFPCLSAALGGIWCVGKVLYNIGYSTGEPKKRMQGGFAYIGVFGLLGTSIATALGFLHIV